MKNLALFFRIIFSSFYSQSLYRRVLKWNGYGVRYAIALSLLLYIILVLAGNIAINLLIDHPESPLNFILKQLPEVRVSNGSFSLCCDKDNSDQRTIIKSYEGREVIYIDMSDKPKIDKKANLVYITKNAIIFSEPDIEITPDIIGAKYTVLNHENILKFLKDNQLFVVMISMLFEFAPVIGLFITNIFTVFIIKIFFDLLNLKQLSNIQMLRLVNIASTPATVLRVVFIIFGLYSSVIDNIVHFVELCYWFFCIYSVRKIRYL